MINTRQCYQCKVELNNSVFFIDGNESDEFCTLKCAEAFAIKGMRFLGEQKEVIATKE